MRTSAAIAGVSAMAALAGACTSSSPGAAGDGGASDAACTSAGDGGCGSVTEIATADELLRVAEGLKEARDKTIGGDFGEALRPSNDLRVTVDLDIDVTAYQTRNALCPPPVEDAGPRPLRCHETVFAPEKPFYTGQNLLGVDMRRLGTTYPTGVICSAPVEASNAGGPDGCTKIHVAAGTVLRLQRVVEVFGFANIEHHYIRVVRACATPCEATETRCRTSAMCFESGRAFCLFCEGGEAATCVCRSGCTAAANGTDCRYASSDDTQVHGACAAGVCKP